MSEFDELLRRVKYYEDIDEKYTGDIGEEVRKRAPLEIEVRKQLGDEGTCPVCSISRGTKEKVWVSDKSGIICRSCWQRKVELKRPWSLMTADDVRLLWNNTCPVCREQKDEYRVNIFKTKAMCESCLSLYRGKIGAVYNFVIDEVIRYMIDPMILMRMRKSRGISTTQFAKMCGWSQGYQSRLENGDYNTISEEQRDKIVSAIRRWEI